MSFKDEVLKGLNPILAKKISTLMHEAERLEAYDGVQRMQFVCDQYKKLTPDTVYRLIDIESFQVEIEEAHGRLSRVHGLHMFRNALSLAPLIVTWGALFFAVQQYQTDLQKYPGDQQIPFLTLWQSGFHHTTTFTFTGAALTDIICLGSYLGVIIWAQFVDLNIQRRAAKFVQKLRLVVDEFIQVVINAQLAPITSPEDVNKIALAVKQVIDLAIEESKQLTRNSEQAVQRVTSQAQKAIDASNKRVEELLNVRVSPLLKTFNENTETFQRLLGTLQGNIATLAKDVQNSFEINKGLLESVRENTTASKEFQTQVIALKQGEDAILTQLQVLVRTITESSAGTTLATEQIHHTATALSSLTQDLEQSFQVVATRMDADETRSSQFQQNMLGFQKQLEAFESTLQHFMQTSQDLGKNIGVYTDLGTEIQQQVRELHTTEHDILVQFQTVSSDLSTAARSINLATSSMQQTTGSVQQVAAGVDKNMQTTIQALVGNVQRATASLGNAEKQLSHTANTLYQVVNALAALDTARMDQSEEGGLFDWLFRRGRSRSRP